jgi:hypothetical protein
MPTFSAYNLFFGILHILIAVGVGCFIGGIVEYRNWTRVVAWGATPFIKLGKLPYVCGTAFITALASNSAASSILSGAYMDKKISKSEMIIGGMINSFPAKYSHLIRMMPIIIFLLGKAGILYCILQLILEILITTSILSVARFRKQESMTHDNINNMDVPIEKRVRSWKETFKQSWSRTHNILKRVAMITIPLYILVSYGVAQGVFKAENFKGYFPQFLSNLITPEVMSITVAKLGGIPPAFAIAGKYLEAHLITVPQLIAGLLIANFFSYPVNTIRRNLPIALGIYPGKVGFFIPFSLLALRLLFNLITILLLTNSM